MGIDIHLLAIPMLTLATTYWLHSTLLLAATWIFVRTCRIRSDALRERLWKLAAVVPLFTAPLGLSGYLSQPIIEIALDRLCRTDVPQSAARNANEDTEASARPTLSTPQAGEMDTAPIVRPAPNTPLDASPLPAEIVHASPGVAEQSAAPAQLAIDPSLPASRWPLPFICSVGFVGLFLVGGAVRTACQSIWFHWRLRHSHVITGPISVVLADVLRRADVPQRVRLLSCPWCGQPAAFGLFRWTIVLPVKRIDELAEDELRALFAHEIAHLVRGDALWLSVCRVLCSCLAFQPLNFVIRKELRRSAELLCDEWAVRKSTNAYALARCLTRVAEWDRRGLPWSEALAAISGRSSLSDRVERLIAGPARHDAWNTRRRRRTVAAAALAVAFVFAYFAPRTAITAEPKAPPAESDLASRFPPRKSASTLAESVDLLDHELRQLKVEMRGIDEMIDRGQNHPELRYQDWGKRLRARTARIMKRERRLVELWRAQTASPTRGD